MKRLNLVVLAAIGAMLTSYGQCKLDPSAAVFVQHAEANEAAAHSRSGERLKTLAPEITGFSKKTSIFLKNLNFFTKYDWTNCGF